MPKSRLKKIKKTLEGAPKANREVLEKFFKDPAIYDPVVNKSVNELYESSEEKELSNLLGDPPLFSHPSKLEYQPRPDGPAPEEVAVEKTLVKKAKVQSRKSVKHTQSQKKSTGKATASFTPFEQTKFNRTLGSHVGRK